MALSMNVNPHLPSISAGREGVIAFRTSCPGTWATLRRLKIAFRLRPGTSGVSERVEAIVLVFLLTATNALFRFRNVFILCIKKSRNLSRFLSAAILLFLFFLPLHIHFPANPQVSEDCACCYFGGRVQMDLAPAAVILGPSDEVSFLILRITEAPIQVIIKSELARAPPYSLAA
jgi:hypothetical protein